MTDRSALSLDDFVSSHGSGATEQESVEDVTTPPSHPEEAATEETVEAESVETEEEQAEQEDASAEDVVEDEDGGEDEEAEATEDEAEASEDETAEDTDAEDEEVLEKSFSWNDDLEVDVPGMGKTTLKELRRGSMREDDYQRKTQKLAATERELTAKVEAQETTLTNERQQLSERLEALDATLDVMRAQFEQGKPSIEDRRRLIEEDPQEYQRLQLAELEQQEKLQDAEKQVAKAREDAKRVEVEKADQAKKQNDAFIAEQRVKLIEAKPEWAETPALNDALTGFSKLAEPYGFTPDDIFGITDPRALLLLDGMTKANAEITRLNGELKAATTKAKKVQDAKPALKKKAAQAPKRIKPVSSQPAEPKNKAAAFRDRIMKKQGSMTAKDYEHFHALGGGR